MGPFVPELISDQLNLVVALLLGIGFGFVLEQAGFSSSRRLAGVFYGGGNGNERCSVARLLWIA